MHRVLEGAHLPRASRLLQELHSLARPGGCFYSKGREPLERSVERSLCARCTEYWATWYAASCIALRELNVRGAAGYES